MNNWIIKNYIKNGDITFNVGDKVFLYKRKKNGYPKKIIDDTPYIIKDIINDVLVIALHSLDGVGWSQIIKVHKTYMIENSIIREEKLNSILGVENKTPPVKYSEPRSRYKAIEAYKEVDKPNRWVKCPNCRLRPLVWEFDNGRSTACGCGKNEYNNHSIHAESIMSYARRNNWNCTYYDWDELRKNWNHWVNTDEILFDPIKRSDGRW